MVAVERETAAERFDAFAHAAQAVAFAGDGMLAVVLDERRRWPSSVRKRRRQVVARAWRTMLVTASRRASARTVSSAGRDWCGRGRRHRRQDERDAGGVEGAARGFDFGGEAAGAVAADGFADFGECGAGGAFDVGDFGGGAGGSLGSSRSMRRPASSALRTMTESVWPRTSWRSRAMRSRSATAARARFSSCAARSLQSARRLLRRRRCCRRR